MPWCDLTGLAGLSECNQLSTAPVTPQMRPTETFAGRLILSWLQSFIHLLWAIQTWGQVCTPPVRHKWMDKPLTNWLETSEGTPRWLGALSIQCMRRGWANPVCRYFWGDLPVSSSTSWVRRQSQALRGSQERLWNLHPWRCSKLDWTWPWASCFYCESHLGLGRRLD